MGTLINHVSYYTCGENKTHNHPINLAQDTIWAVGGGRVRTQDLKKNKNKPWSGSCLFFIASAKLLSMETAITVLGSGGVWDMDVLNGLPESLMLNNHRTNVVASSSIGFYHSVCPSHKF